MADPGAVLRVSIMVCLVVSVEVFVNDGEQVMTATFMTDIAAKGISFFADGQVEMDIVKYDLFWEE